jgi:hypothetical protein
MEFFNLWNGSRDFAAFSYNWFNFRQQTPGVLLILPLFSYGTTQPISDSAPLLRLRRKFVL